MSVSPSVLVALGTRPEIIKLAPVVRDLDQRSISYTLVHTGQHYSDNLDTVFFDQLDLPAPDYRLDVGSGSHGRQTAKMLTKLEEVIETEEPSWVLVQGDTNSVLSGALAASKMETTLGHVEAGLRSGDRNMPEETNRVLTDHASDYLFAPTEDAYQNLVDEGLDDRTTVTGNTVVDAVEQHVDIATEKSSVLTDHSLTAGEYGVLTAHRAENVDSEPRFRGILDGVARVSREFGQPFLYPIHPRAAERLDRFGIGVPDSIRIVNPLEYLDFLRLQRNASVIITDSGGVQEEACILETPCVTVRESTERPETLGVGANRVVGTDPTDIADGASRMIDDTATWSNPFGDGTAAEQISEIILSDT